MPQVSKRKSLNTSSSQPFKKLCIQHEKRLNAAAVGAKEKQLNAAVGAKEKQLNAAVEAKEKRLNAAVEAKEKPLDAAVEDDRDELTVAVDEARRLFRKALFDFAIKRDEGNKDFVDKEEEAGEWLEARVAEEYEEIKKATVELFQWLGSVPPTSEAGDSPVLELQGFQAAHDLDEGMPRWVELGKKLKNGAPVCEKLLGARCESLRGNPSFVAWEAFFALLSILSARKEKTWLELFPTQDELNNKMKRLIKQNKLCKSKTSERRKDAIRAHLEKEELAYGYGFFGHFLVSPDATLRVVLEPGKSLTPAVLTITENVPLFRCLGCPKGNDNGDAPLRSQAKSIEWCEQAGTQFAFQPINLEAEDEESPDHRLATKDLKPDPVLRSYLLSKEKNAVYLEVVASLAPRAMAKDHNHSAMVKAELARIMREAKLNGKVVVFALGSDSPLMLFKKVYNRPPISDYGLQCGYLRWRASADKPWAREAKWDDRCCICMQLP